MKSKIFYSAAILVFVAVFVLVGKQVDLAEDNTPVVEAKAVVVSTPPVPPVTVTVTEIRTVTQTIKETVYQPVEVVKTIEKPAPLNLRDFASEQEFRDFAIYYTNFYHIHDLSGVECVPIAEYMVQKAYEQGYFMYVAVLDSPDMAEYYGVQINRGSAHMVCAARIGKRIYFVEQNGQIWSGFAAY